MLFYTPSSLSQGYPSYIPRRSYRPASFYQYDYEEPSGLSSFTPEDLAYTPLPHTTVSPRTDAATRYRRALHELEAAEQEYEAQVTLQRAHQVALVRQRAAAIEAARRERAQAIQAEIERLERARVMQALVEERTAHHQRVLRPRAASSQAPWQGFLRALVDPDAAEDVAPQRRFSGCRPSRPQCAQRPARRDNETFNVGDLLGLFGGVHPEPEPEPVAPSQEPSTSTTQHKSTEPRPQPQAEPTSTERDDGAPTFSDILDFFHSIASQAREAGNINQPTQELSGPSPPEAAPADAKNKGKAKAEPPREPGLFQALFGERMKGTLDQEIRDMEQAIKLSLQDRDAANAKKAHGSKAAKSSPNASSSRVKFAEPSSSGRAPSPARGGTSSAAIPHPAPQPVSPLTAIRAIRSHFAALQSSFKFPAALDFDDSELAVTPNNAPVRAYEQAVNGLLEQLDAIESDGDEEVREVRREVVREVERALEDVERKIEEQAPRPPVPELTKEEVVDGYDAGNGRQESEVPATRDVLPVPADIAPVVEDVKITLPRPAPVGSPTDAEVDLAIYKEYRSASPVAASSEAAAVANSERADAATPATATQSAPPTNGELSTPDTADGVEGSAATDSSLDISDSAVTITPASALVASSERRSLAPGSPDPETFLTSMSHEQFTFPPKPASQSQSSTGQPEVHDDAVLVDDSDPSEGGSLKGAGDDGWSEVDA